VLIAFAISAFVLFATADERVYGLITDGQIMTRTAYSIVALGELGIARGHPVNILRPAGDAVTRYGMAPTLVRVLPMSLAPSWERAFGIGSSQTLFVLSNILLILAAAWAAGSLARTWGAGEKGAARAVLATSLASPLWAYASSDFSEPLQAALLGGVFAAAARSRAAGVAPRRACLFAAAAGGLAGGALLAKSIFIVLFPLVVVLVVSGVSREGRLARGLAAAAGFAPLLGVWVAFEIARFGRPFASYEGEHFNHPVLDGLWRLTVGPNKGLLLYFPLALLFVPGVRRLLSRDRTEALGLLGFTGFLLVATAAWWSWDGTAGWGPRLLVPLVPLISAAAAVAAADLPALMFRVLFGLGMLVNALGALQPDALTTWYYFILPNRPLSAEELPRWPSFATLRNPRTGAPELLALHEVALRPAFSPIRLDAWLLRKRLAGGDVLAALRTPPWRTDVPGQEAAAPLDRVMPTSALVFHATPFRWPHLGMSMTRKSEQLDTVLAYVDSVYDQALRGQDLKDGERAVQFAERAYELLPGPQSAQTLAEAFRIANRRRQFSDFVTPLPREWKKAPEFGIVLALFARDVGDEEKARSNLSGVVRVAPRPEYKRLEALPVREWPATFRELQLSAAPWGAKTEAAVTPPAPGTPADWNVSGKK
jgi:hypothetical protein